MNRPTEEYYKKYRVSPNWNGKWDIQQCQCYFTLRSPKVYYDWVGVEGISEFNTKQEAIERYKFIQQEAEVLQ